MDPNDHVPISTGVPPSVKHAQALKKVLDVCEKTDAKVTSFMANLKQAVSDAVDAKVAAEGGVNITILQSTLQQMKDEIFGKIESIQVAQDQFLPEEIEAANFDLEDSVRVAGPFEFHYKGTNWPIPESFQFPKECKRMHGWRLWLKGSLIVVGSQQYKIKPYRKLSGCDLHSKELKNEYKLNWKPFFSRMMEAPGLTIPHHLANIDEAFVQTSYTIATEFLKENYSYIFKAGDGVVCNYSIATWSSKIKRSEVIKKGTPEDVLHLPPCKAHNKPHQQKRTFTVARSVVRKRAKAG